MIRFQKVTDFTKPEIAKYLVWWSLMTAQEKQKKRMVYRSADWFKKNLMIAILAFSENGEIVGAGGLFAALDKDDQKIFFNGKLVVELGSLYVSPEYREQHIATECVKMRLDFVREHRFFPVMVTQDLVMSERILNGEKVQLNSVPQLTGACSKLRHCGCEAEGKSEEEKLRCEFCPKLGRTILGFREFVANSI